MRALARGSAALGASALLAGLAVVPAVAATPESSTLTAPKGTGSTVSAWSGTLDAPSAVVLVDTDAHALSVKVPGKAKKYFKKRDATVSVEMSWEGSPVEDLDLYVYDESGAEIASSIVGDGVEQVTFPITGPGDYSVEVEGFTSTPGVAYKATATLTVTPKVPIPCGRAAAQARC